MSDHVPVMVDEVCRLLVTRPDATIVDLNVGGGGHAEAICRVLGSGDFRYVGLDLDARALDRTRERLRAFGNRVTLVERNHRELVAVLEELGMSAVSGILFDLGFSSIQLDDAERGFSFDADGPLDMRYSTAARSAEALVATASAHELTTLFKRYGDLRGAGKLAAAIVSARNGAPLRTTGELCKLVDVTLRPPFVRRRKVLSQVFQAIRVAVNDEVESFRDALSSCHASLARGGVLCVLAYESVTDRIAKLAFREDGDKDVYGNPIEPLRWERLTRGALRPSEREVAANPRARSARLRAARKRPTAGEERRT